MASVHRQKIIIDSDCGVDDAVALLLALSSKDIAEIIGITCCFGNTSLDNVCLNVMRVLTVCKETSIPVYRGCKGSWMKRDIPESVHGTDGLGNIGHDFSIGDQKESDIPAPLALINLTKKYPQQVTLIAIGPLTNLAIAHRMDPAFTERLKSIVIMGGNYKGIGNVTEVAEFNFYCDPESANIIVSEAACPVVLVPWETAVEYGMKWDTYCELLKMNTPKSNFFKRITELGSTGELKNGIKEVYDDCDFLAVVAALYPQGVKSSFKSLLRVEYEGILTTGLTVLERESPCTSNRKKAEIITDYDEEFLNSVRKQMLL